MSKARDELRKDIYKIVRTHRLSVASCQIATDAILSQVDTYVKEIIGEDQSLSHEPTGIGRIVHPDANRVNWRNQLRTEQRKRAGLEDEEIV